MHLPDPPSNVTDPLVEITRPSAKYDGHSTNTRLLSGCGYNSTDGAPNVTDTPSNEEQQQCKDVGDDFRGVQTLNRVWFVPMAF